MEQKLKGQVSKAFSMQGLQLKPDAMKYLVALIQEKGDTDLLNKILNTIDKNSCK